MIKNHVIGNWFGYAFYVLFQLCAVLSEPHFPLSGIWPPGLPAFGGRPPFQPQPQLQQQPIGAVPDPSFIDPIRRIIGYQLNEFNVPQRIPQDPAGMLQPPIGVPIQFPAGGFGGIPNYPKVPFNPIYIILGAVLVPMRPQGIIETMPTAEPDGSAMDSQMMNQKEPEGMLDPEPVIEESIGTRIDSRHEPEECSHFSDGGSCLNLSECKSSKGYPTGYCRDVSKFCCIFRVSCGATIQKRAVHFRSPSWPLTKTVNSGSCGTTIKKLNSDICYVRILAKDLELPAGIGFCQDLSLDVEVGGKSYEPLCGSLSKSSYDVDVSKVSSISIKIRSKVATRLKWHLYIRQIPCSSSAQKKLWPQAGEQPKPTEIVPAPQKPSMDKEPSQPSASQKSCGMSYGLHRSEANISERKQLPVQRDEGEQEEEKEEEEVCEDCRSSSFPNPLLQSLEWSVPRVNDSFLYKYAGTPLTVGTRVTYGQMTKKHEFPWAVAMYNNGRFHCGGSLISEKHVLTAAHCVIKYRKRTSRIKLNLGDWNINSNTDGKAVISGISKIVTHPGYSTATLKYDVAVITLSQPVKFTDTLLPVCLPSSNDKNLEGKLITVTGWGRDEKNRLQSILMKHSANVLSNRVCNQRWREKGAPDGIIADSMLCMDPQDGDSCKGDSGGPAIIQDPAGSGRYKQVAIVSFGSASCTDKRLPGVYTRVTNVLNWIVEQMV